MVACRLSLTQRLRSVKNYQQENPCEFKVIDF
jgi:hypothetical protein